MSAQSYTTTYYRLTCDRCGALGPRGTVEMVAIAAAADEDWQRFTRWTGIRYVTDDLCPACFPDWEREQEERHQ